MENPAVESWTTLFEECGPALLLLARQWTSSHADAEDAVQNAFVRLWKSGRHDVEDLRPYLFTCVKRSALDLQRGFLRRQRREARVARTEAEPLFESTNDRDEFRALVEHALSQLPVEQREVIVLKVWGELTFPQIGAALGISPNTAASRHRYALEALRRHLNKEAVL